MRSSSESYLKNEIISQSRHLFIYGYHDEKREQLIKELEEENPIRIDSNKPMAVYVEDFALKKEDYDKTKVDRSHIQRISNEYLHFSIGHRIIQKTIQDVDVSIINERIKKLLDRINCYSKNSNNTSVQDIESLERLLEESKKFYLRYFHKYIKGEPTPSIEEIAIPFMMIEQFVSDWKRTLQNTSHVGLIIEKKEPVEIESIRSVNFLVGARINGDISMKVVTEPEAWDTYHDFNGQLVECVHDYGTVELDNSVDEYMKKIKKGWWLK